MALAIVTGGTTDATDGTLVSSSNKITFTALSPSYVTAHVRTDTADTYASNQVFTIPTGVEISFDGGSTWKGVADSPYTYSGTIGDLNQTIRIRQTAIQASAIAAIDTSGTFSSCTALSDVSGLSATAGNTTAVVSWSSVANRTYYTVQRATDAGFTTNLTTLTTTNLTGSYSDAGLTNGTTYYYRVKAIGTGQYKDSANWTSTSVTPTARQARWIQWEWIAPHQGPDGTLLNVLEIEVVAAAANRASGPDLLPASSVSSWSASESYSSSSPDVRPYRISDKAFGGDATSQERWATTLANENNSHWVKVDLGSSQTIHSWRMQRYGTWNGSAFNTKQPYNFKMWVSTLSSPSTKVIGADSNADWTLVDSGTLDLTTGSANGDWQAWRTVS